MQMLLLNIYKYLFTSMKHNVSSNRKKTTKRQEAINKGCRGRDRMVV
jgi:hypothetical protein